MALRINGQLIALIGFTLVCLTVTFILTALLPSLVPQEQNCDLHNTEQDALLLLSPSGKRLTVQLNVEDTVKRPGKYLRCPDATQNYTRSAALAAQANVTCRQFQWRLSQFISTVTDCFDLRGEDWFGGQLTWHQAWPMSSSAASSGVVQNRTAFVPGDVYQRAFGGVMERYWISGGGFSIFVDQRVPLWVQIGDGKLCLTGSREAGGVYDLTARKANEDLLAYTVCSGTDSRSLYRATQFWRGPSQTPARDLFVRPIWSTWAFLKGNITQESVLDFANTINAHNLSASQLEVDDKWSTNYGDHQFDTRRFPRPAEMVQSVHALGMNISLWTHPFANNHTKTFELGRAAAEARGENSSFLLATAEAPRRPALTSWWRSDGGVGGKPSAGVADVTVADGEGARHLESALQRLRSDFGVDSFKLDAGEANWLPAKSRLKGYPDEPNPGWFAHAWAQLGHRLDPLGRRQEVRVGFRAQSLPLMVRAIDKDSHWGLDNGLKAMVASALTHCLAGYSFHLPDMVGGNAYCEGPDGLDGRCYPEKELYLRWLQASVFMPAVQLSVPPWVYDEDTVNITRRLLAIREEPRFQANMETGLSDFLNHGDPLIRPMWWLGAPTTPQDLQFTLGPSILVAPVLDKGATSRSVTFPAGRWRPWFGPDNGSEDVTGPDNKTMPVPMDSVGAYWLV